MTALFLNSRGLLKRHNAQYGPTHKALREYVSSLRYDVGESQLVMPWYVEPGSSASARGMGFVNGGIGAAASFGIASHSKEMQ